MKTLANTHNNRRALLDGVLVMLACIAFAGGLLSREITWLMI